MQLQLSPMESVSCWAFRVMCTRLGADRTYTEMVRAKGLGKNNKASWSLIDTFGEENCHVQLMAVKPNEISKYFSALDERIVEDDFLKNIKGYNLNLGCPSPDIIQEGGGAALLKRTSRVCQLIEKLGEHTKLPLSIKIRLGLNKKEMDNKVYLNLIKGVSELSLKNFKETIVHFKHAKEKSFDPFHYEAIPEIKKAWKGNLTLNGGYSDVFLPKEKVYGVMFARSAIKDPLVFSRIKGKKYTASEARKMFESLSKKHVPKKKYTAYLDQRCSLFNS